MMNRVVLVGRLVRDPELKKTPSGASVTSFTIAVDNRVRSGSEKTTSFIPCNAWNQTAENVSKYVRKGSLIGIDGRLVQRSYTASDGRKVNVLDVTAESVTFLEKRQDVASSSDDRSYDSPDQIEEEAQGMDISTDSDLPF